MRIVKPLLRLSRDGWGEEEGGRGPVQLHRRAIASLSKDMTVALVAFGFFPALWGGPSPAPAPRLCVLCLCDIPVTQGHTEKWEVRKKEEGLE